MHNIRFILVSVIIGAAISCNNSPKEETVQKTSTPPVLEHKSEPGTAFSTLEAVQTADLTTTIHFKEFRLDIQNFSTFDENDHLTAGADTLTIDADIGENLSRSSIVISEELTDVKIEQRYETSITISNEGPHCDIVDWKHYTSEWKILKSDTKNIFTCTDYSEKEQEKFPEVTIQELREAIKKHCGEEGAEMTKNIKSPTDEPSSVGINRIYIRISGTQKSTGKTVSKHLIFDIPMGC